MKTFLKTFLGLVAFSLVVKADHLGTIDLTNKSASYLDLSECQGHASVKTNWDSSIQLNVYGNNNCTRVVVNGQEFTSEIGYDGTRSIQIRIETYGQSYHSSSVIVKSISGKTQDRFTIVKSKKQAPVVTDEDWVKLSYCQGFAKFDVQNGQANFKIKGINLNKCRSVTLYGDGSSRTYDLNSESPSFTVPKALIKFGTNKVKVSFKTPYYDVVDVLYLKFPAY